MKRLLKVTLLMLPVVLVATGCDFFRRIAGRPTSEDIAVMAENIRIEEETLAAREDSLKAVAARRADSLATAAALDSLSHLKVLPTTKVKGVADAGNVPRYSIIIGAFSDSGNAERLASQVSSLGFPAKSIKFGNSFTGVGLCGTDNPVDLLDSYNKVLRQDFCPSAVWILENMPQ